MKSILFLLTPKSLISYLFDDDSLRQAVEKMEYHRFALIPVITHDGKYVRSVSEGDILYAMKRNGLSFDTIHRYPLDYALSNRDIKAVTVDATIDDLKQFIVTQNYVPVTDDKGVFIGIITRKAVMSELFSHNEEKEKENGK